MYHDLVYLFSDEDLIDSVLAANSSNSAYLGENSPHESTFGSRRNSIISTASDSASSSLSNRSHMAPIEIPYDFSQNIASAGFSVAHGDVSSANSINSNKRFNQQIIDGSGNTTALSLPSSGENSRSSTGSTRRRSSLIEVTPVNPSIPQPRTAADLHLGAQPPPPTIHIEPAPPLGAERKPPTGYTNTGN